MAIRIGPPPTLARLRINWHSTCNYCSQHARAFQLTARQIATAILEQYRRTTERAVEHVSWRARARARQRALLVEFVGHYEDLVDLLCWAAKDGVHTDRDLRYGELRRWMQLNYHKLRRPLRGHLEPWEGPFDPFEELFAPERVDEVINDVAGITYMMQTRAALEAFQAELSAGNRR